MSSNSAQVSELRAMFEQVKRAFVAIPPHPSQQQAPPQQQMPPEAAAAQQMPPGAAAAAAQQMPPEAAAAAQQMPPGAQPAAPAEMAGGSPEMMGLLEQMVGKIEEVSRDSKQQIQTLEQRNAEIANELKGIRMELDNEKMIKEERKKLIEAVGL
jgi:hypothetical protein